MKKDTTIEEDDRQSGSTQKAYVWTIRERWKRKNLGQKEKQQKVDREK